MGILEDGHDGPLSIERMIFHLVGLDGDKGPTVLEKIAPSEHEKFFLERIRSAFRGNQYRFKEKSVTEGWLKAISEAPSVFAERSVDIATELDRTHGEPRRVSRRPSVTTVFPLAPPFEFHQLRPDEEAASPDEPQYRVFVDAVHLRARRFLRAVICGT